METVQYNNQMMPRMEIPDVQTIEKLNYMSQPGAHMPLHLQRHVVPPQHLHMAPPHQHQRSVVNQPPHHMPTMMIQPQPEVFHPQMYHHHHHHHHLAFPAQAYEGVSVAYVDHPGYMQPNPPHQPSPPNLQPAVVAANHHHQPAVASGASHHQEKRWSESPETARPKPKQRRFDKGHVDRRKDNASGRPSNQQTPSHRQPATRSPPVTLYRRGDPAPRTTPPANEATGEAAAAATDCASGGEDGPAGDRPPPVVILSGAAKDVPGIEFGFAVNPDLVDQQEEEEEEQPTTPGEYFDAYFRPPAIADVDSFNHDKVVNYVVTGRLIA